MRITVNITIDNRGRLITNAGEKRNVLCEKEIAEHFTLSGDTKNVTIKAYNREKEGGILASFSNNMVTDGSWQCADMSSCPEVKCAAWKQAVTYGFNDEHSKNKWKKMNEIESTAQWIWVKDSTAKMVWCRKAFGELKICNIFIFILINFISLQRLFSEIQIYIYQ